MAVTMHMYDLARWELNILSCLFTYEMARVCSAAALVSRQNTVSMYPCKDSKCKTADKQEKTNI